MIGTIKTKADKAIDWQITAVANAGKVTGLTDNKVITSKRRKEDCIT